MPLSARLLRPILNAVANFLLSTISGEQLVNHSGEELRTIQDA